MITDPNYHALLDKYSTEDALNKIQNPGETYQEYGPWSAAKDTFDTSAWKGVGAVAKDTGELGEDIQGWSDNPIVQGLGGTLSRAGKWIGDYSDQQAAENKALAQQYVSTAPQRVEDIKFGDDQKGVLNWLGHHAVQSAPYMGAMMGGGLAGYLVGGPRGALGGAMLGSAVPHLGENVQKLEAAGQPDNGWKKYGATALQSGAELLAPARSLQVLSKLGKGALGRAISGRAKEAARVGAYEAGTEVFQDVVRDTQAGIMPFSYEGYASDKLNAGIAGFALGGTMHAAGEAANAAVTLPLKGAKGLYDMANERLAQPLMDKVGEHIQIERAPGASLFDRPEIQESINNHAQAELFNNTGVPAYEQFIRDNLNPEQAQEYIQRVSQRVQDSAVKLKDTLVNELASNRINNKSLIDIASNVSEPFRAMFDIPAIQYDADLLRDSINKRGEAEAQSELNRLEQQQVVTNDDRMSIYDTSIQNPEVSSITGNPTNTLEHLTEEEIASRISGNTENSDNAKLQEKKAKLLDRYASVLYSNIGDAKLEKENESKLHNYAKEKGIKLSDEDIKAAKITNAPNEGSLVSAINANSTNDADPKRKYILNDAARNKYSKNAKSSLVDEAIDSITNTPEEKGAVSVVSLPQAIEVQAIRQARKQNPTASAQELVPIVEGIEQKLTSSFASDIRANTKNRGNLWKQLVNNDKVTDAELVSNYSALLNRNAPVINANQEQQSQQGQGATPNSPSSTLSPDEQSLIDAYMNSAGGRNPDQGPDIDPEMAALINSYDGTSNPMDQNVPEGFIEEDAFEPSKPLQENYYEAPEQPNKYSLFNTKDEQGIEGTVYANKDQTEAIDKLKGWSESDSPYFVLAGRGGTGKTTVISKALKEIGAADNQVMFALPTHKAKGVIERQTGKSGEFKQSKFDTTASLLGKLPQYRGKEKVFEIDQGLYDKRREQLEEEGVKYVIVDEVSMLDESDLEVLHNMTNDLGIKVIFMGDNVQLPPVMDETAKEALQASREARGIEYDESEIDVSPMLRSFSGLSDVVGQMTGNTLNEFNSHVLKQRMRQKEGSPIVPITDVLADAIVHIYRNFSNDRSNVSPGISFLYEDQKTDAGNVLFRTQNQAYDLFAKAYKANKEAMFETKWINFNTPVKEASITVKKALRKRLFAPEELYVNGKDGQEHQFVKGENLMIGPSATLLGNGNIAAQATKEDGLFNGTEVVVRDHVKNDTVVIEDPFSDGKQTYKKIPVRTLDVETANGNVYTLVLTRGNSTSKALQTAFRENTIDRHKKGILSDKQFNELMEEKDRGKLIAAELTEGLSPGYIINVHKAQGSTYKNVFVDVQNIVGGTNAGLWIDKLRAMYTATSRASTNLIMVGSPNGKYQGKNVLKIGTAQRLKDDSQVIQDEIKKSKEPSKLEKAPGPVSVSKIISGGQTGGDKGGLLAAKELGIPTGGFAPKGFRTEKGNDATLGSEYGLVESDASSYPQRTMQNVDAADLTIAFKHPDLQSTGTSKTIGYAHEGKWKHPERGHITKLEGGHKPVLVLSPMELQHVNGQAIRDAIHNLGIENPVINIAGHRESSFRGLEGFVKGALIHALSKSDKLDGPTKKEDVNKEGKDNKEPTKKEDSDKDLKNKNSVSIDNVPDNVMNLINEIANLSFRRREIENTVNGQETGPTEKQLNGMANYTRAIKKIQDRLDAQGYTKEIVGKLVREKREKVSVKAVEKIINDYKESGFKKLPDSESHHSLLDAFGNSVYKRKSESFKDKGYGYVVVFTGRQGINQLWSLVDLRTGETVHKSRSGFEVYGEVREKLNKHIMSKINDSNRQEYINEVDHYIEQTKILLEEWKGNKDSYTYKDNEKLLKTLNKTKRLLNKEIDIKGNDLKNTEVKSINVWSTDDSTNLSNFSEREFGYKGNTYPTVEHAFQAAKIDYIKEDGITVENIEKNEKILNDIITSTDPKEAKRLGRQFKNLDVEKWDAESSQVMEDIILASFKSNDKAAQELVDTGDAELTHINPKGETDKWTTEFPRILMKVRKFFQDKGFKSSKDVNTEKQSEKKPEGETPKSRIVVRDVKTLRGAMTEYGIVNDWGVISIRPTDANITEHFGNPFITNKSSSVQNSEKYVLNAGTPEQVSKLYSDWIKGISLLKDPDPQRRQWIIDQIKSGALDNKPILYFQNTPVNHARELQKLIDNKEWISKLSEGEAPKGEASKTEVKKEFDSINEAVTQFYTGKDTQLKVGDSIGIKYSGKGKQGDIKVGDRVYIPETYGQEYAGVPVYVIGATTGGNLKVTKPIIEGEPLALKRSAVKPEKIKQVKAKKAKADKDVIDQADVTVEGRIESGLKDKKYISGEKKTSRPILEVLPTIGIIDNIINRIESVKSKKKTSDEDKAKLEGFVQESLQEIRNIYTQVTKSTGTWPNGAPKYALSTGHANAKLLTQARILTNKAGIPLNHHDIISGLAKHSFNNTGTPTKTSVIHDKLIADAKKEGNISKVKELEKELKEIEVKFDSLPKANNLISFKRSKESDGALANDPFFVDYELGKVNTDNRAVKQVVSVLNRQAKRIYSMLDKVNASSAAISNSKADIIHDPSLLLTDNTNKYPPNIKSVMALVGSEWLINRGQETIIKTHDDMAKMLGVDPKYDFVDKTIIPELKTWGMSLNDVAQSLGETIINKLSLDISKDAPQYTKERIQNALGMTLITSMVKTGQLHMTTVPTAIVSEYKAKASGDMFEGASNDGNQLSGLEYTQFIRLNNEKLIIKQKDAISTDKNLEAQTEIFGENSRVRDIRKEPFETKQEKLKGSETLIPEAYKENINRAGRVAWRVIDDTEKLVAGLDNQFFLDMLKAPTDADLKRTNLDEYEAENSKRDALQKEIDELMSYVNNSSKDNKLYSAFYFPYEVWKNFRIGLASNTINPQASKLHRFLIAADGWNSTINMNKAYDESIKFDNQGENDYVYKDNLILAMGQGFKVDIDKNLLQNSLDEFKNEIYDYTALDSKDRFVTTTEKGKAVKAAVGYINRLLDGETLSRTDQSRLAKAIGALGVKAHSYAAAITLAKFDRALNNKDKTFTSQLPVEIDGVTNGTANALVQYSPYYSDEEIKANPSLQAVNDHYDQRQAATGVYKVNQIQGVEANDFGYQVWKNTPSKDRDTQLDNYENSAAAANRILPEIDEAIAKDFNNLMAAMNAGETVQESLSKHEVALLKSYFSAKDVAKLPTLSKDAKKKVIEVLNNKVKATLDIFGKFDRKTFKDPLMVFQYMASINTIATNSTNQAFNNFMGNLGLKQRLTNEMHTIRDNITKLEHGKRKFKTVDANGKEVIKEESLTDEQKKNLKIEILKAQKEINRAYDNLMALSTGIDGKPPNITINIPRVEAKSANFVIETYSNNKTNPLFDPNNALSAEAYKKNKDNLMVSGMPVFFYNAFKTMKAVATKVDEQVFTSEFGDLMLTRSRMNFNLGLASKMSKAIFNKKLKDAKAQAKSEGRAFTQADEDAVIEEMQKAGQLLTVKVPMTEANDTEHLTELLVANKERKYLDGEEGKTIKRVQDKSRGSGKSKYVDPDAMKVSTYELTPEASAILAKNPDYQLSSKDFIKKEGVTRREVGGKISVKVISDDIGIAIPLIQLPMDADVNNKMMGSFEILNVHDAILVASNLMHTSGKVYNDFYSNTILWNMVESIHQSTNRIISDFINNYLYTNAVDTKDFANISSHIEDSLPKTPELKADIFPEHEKRLPEIVDAKDLENMVNSINTNFGKNAEKTTQHKKNKTAKTGVVEQYVTGMAGKVYTDADRANTTHRPAEPVPLLQDTSLHSEENIAAAERKAEREVEKAERQQQKEEYEARKEARKIKAEENKAKYAVIEKVETKVGDQVYVDMVPVWDKADTSPVNQVEAMIPGITNENLYKILSGLVSGQKGIVYYRDEANIHKHTTDQSSKFKAGVLKTIRNKIAPKDRDGNPKEYAPFEQDSLTKNKDLLPTLQRLQMILNGVKPSGKSDTAVNNNSPTNNTPPSKPVNKDKPTKTLKYKFADLDIKKFKKVDYEIYMDNGEIQIKSGYAFRLGGYPMPFVVGKVGNSWIVTEPNSGLAISDRAHANRDNAVKAVKLKLESNKTPSYEIDELITKHLEKRKQNKTKPAGESKSIGSKVFKGFNPVTAAQELVHKQQTQSKVNEFVKKAGLDININVVASENAEALANKLSIKDAKARIKNGNLHGFADPNVNSDGTYNLYVNPRLPKNLQEEIMAHEIGHIIMYSSNLTSDMNTNGANNSKEAQDVLNSFKSWLSANGKSSTQLNQLIRSKKSPLAALHYLRGHAANTKLRSLDQDTQEYMLDFDEWFADEAGKALLLHSKGKLKTKNLVNVDSAKDIKEADVLPFFKRFVKQLIDVVSKIFSTSKPVTNKTTIETIDSRVNASVVRFIESLSTPMSEPGIIDTSSFSPKLKELVKGINNYLEGQTFSQVKAANTSASATGMFKPIPSKNPETMFDKVYNLVMDKDYSLRRLAKKHNSKNLERLADMMFSPRAKQAVDNSYWHQKQMHMAKYEVKVMDIVRNIDKYGQAKILSELYNEKLPDSAVSDGTKQFRSLFRDLAKYMSDNGVKVKLKENYFPEIVNANYVNEHEQEFIEMMERYPKDMKGIQKSWNAEIDEKNKKIDAFNAGKPTVDQIERLEKYSELDIPYALFNNLIGNSRVSNPIETDSQQTPFVRSLNHRVIDFLKGDDLIKWKSRYLERELVTAAQAYIVPVVKRVEFEKRFGALNLSEQKEYVVNTIRKQMKTSGYVSKADRQQIEQDAKTINKMDVLLTNARDEDGLTRAEILKARDYLKAELGVYGRDTAKWLNEKLGIPMPKDTNAPIWKPLQLASSTLMSAANFMVLGLSTVSSIVDPIGIAMRSSDLSLAFESFKNGIRSSIGKNRDELKAVAEAVGSVSDVVTREALEHGYNLNNMTPGVKKANDWFFKTIGLEAWTRTTRLMAVDAARSFLKRHDQNPNIHSARYLKELGIRPGDIHYTKSGKVEVLGYEQHKAATPARQAQNERVKAAIAEFVDESILRPSPSQRPLWASDPHLALLFHLKSFMYSFQKTILNPIVHEAKNGNYAPLLTVGLYIPVGMAITFIKDIVKTMFDDDDDFTPDYKNNWTWSDYLLDGFEKGGTPGILQPIFDINRAMDYNQSLLLTMASPGVDPDTFMTWPIPLNYVFKY